MKIQRFVRQVLFSAVGAGLIATTARPVFAADAAALYKGKCAACHGADGAGSPIGKKIGVRDFRSPEVEKQSDADLAGVIAKGRNKMPAYEKSLSPDEIRALVAYIHMLQK